MISIAHKSGFLLQTIILLKVNSTSRGQYIVSLAKKMNLDNLDEIQENSVPENLEKVAEIDVLVVLEDKENSSLDNNTIIIPIDLTAPQVDEIPIEPSSVTLLSNIVVNVNYAETEMCEDEVKGY